MKKKLLISVAAIFFIVVCFNYQNEKVHSNGTGAPAGHTGSPADGKTCGSNGGCHDNGSPVTLQIGWVSSTVPPGGYKPDTTYTINIFAMHTGSNKFGFSLSPQDASGNLLGTLIANSTTQLKGSGKYITHISTSTTGVNSKAWTFTWTAPSAGTGDVTFYAAFNATNSSGTPVGDTVYTSTLTVQENTSGSALSATATATDATQGNCDGTATVTATGGTQPYTYLWSNSQTTATIDSLCAGTYTVTVTDNAGDTAVATIIVDEQVGIADVYDENSFVILPNPNNGRFNVQMSEYENVQMTIYNALGKEIYSEKIRNPKSEIQNLPKGIYFVNINTGEKNIVRKILVE